MTLAELLSGRQAVGKRWLAVHEAADKLWPRFGAMLERRRWPERFRHMRAIMPGYVYEPADGGGWIMKRHGRVVTECAPLERIVGRITRPVTIFATGPTARDCSWERLRCGERFIIAVNGAPSVLLEQGIRPDLHVVIDRHFVHSGAVHFEKSADVPLIGTHRSAAVLAALMPGIFVRKPVAIVERINAWYGIPVIGQEELRQINRDSGSPFHFPDEPDRKFRIGWSHDPALGVFSGCTVVLSALQIAVGLGATDIEIIGMDLSNMGHAHTTGISKRPNELVSQYDQYILPAFQVMGQALLGTGVAIRNLSPVCPLPAGLFANDGK